MAAARTYWQNLSIRSIGALLVAIFFTFSSIGFAYDLFQALRWPFWWVLTLAGWCGLFSAAMTIASLRSRRLFYGVLPAGILMTVAMFSLPLLTVTANAALLVSGFDLVRRRLVLDAGLWLLATVAGHACFVRFISTEGTKHVRLRTELELAAKVQQTLAPPLKLRAAGYDVQGQCIPSSQMGGDLLDVAFESGALVCYLADVSGHGLQAGVFMAMVKSAVSTALLRSRSVGELLTDLNHVLFGLKGESTTYVTFACVKCHRGGEIEYSLAGHVPMLHYQRHARAVAERALEQFPLGMFADVTYRSERVRLEAGDCLALLTDGITEVTNAGGEEFGLERFKGVLTRSGDRSLASILETSFMHVRQHGPQVDDQTVVLVRTAAEAVFPEPEM